LPKKNIRLIARKPLLRWTVEATLQSKRLDDIVLSTDSEEIARVCPEIFWLKRPSEFAKDESPMIDVVMHAVRELKKNADAYILLQPTAPLRMAKHIDEAVKLLEKRPDAASVVSVCKVPIKYNPEWLFTEQNGYLKVCNNKSLKDRIRRRQDFPPAYQTNGAIYLFRAECLKESPPNLYGDKPIPYIMEDFFGVSIDTPEDFLECERRLNSLEKK